MTRKQIRAAFDKIIKTYATAKPIDVAWENVSFTPTQEAYISVFLIAGEDNHESICYGSESQMGLYQVTIHSPLNGGSLVTETIVEELKALFPAGTRVGTGADTVRITKPIGVTRGMFDKDRYKLVCSIYYDSI